MMRGRVTALGEATLRLTVIGPEQRQQVVDAVLDTGFNGSITLPSEAVRHLQLPFVGHRRAIVGDGRRVVLDLYLATVLWHEQEREVLVLQADGGPCVGMALLRGSRVVLHVVDDGDVLIEPWPATAGSS
jgi:clan AA aspartic protease